MTYDELLSIAQSWIGYRDTNESGFHHNLSALAVFGMMYEHALRPVEEKSLDWYVRNYYATLTEAYTGITGIRQGGEEE